jgi:uncharacterized protein
MRTLLTADWTNLVVATFEADKKLLEKYLPYNTELNDWNGHYYMSLLGFMFSKPIVAGIPAPFYRCFEEVNLRFYIRYRSATGWKNGVVFIKEIAPSRVIGLAARWLYHENFISLPMKHHFAADQSHQETEYYWKIKNEWNYLKLVTTLLPAEPEQSSLESFIRDQYWACTKSGRKKTHEFEIEHPRWNIYPGLSFDMLLNAEAIYGKAFSACFGQKPCSYFLMDGSGTNISYPTLV